MNAIPSQTEIDAIQLTPDEKQVAARHQVDGVMMLRAKRQEVLRRKGFDKGLLAYTLRAYEAHAEMRKKDGGVIALSASRSATLTPALPLTEEDLITGHRHNLEPSTLIRTKLDLDAKAKQRRDDVIALSSSMPDVIRTKPQRF